MRFPILLAIGLVVPSISAHFDRRATTSACSQLAIEFPGQVYNPGTSEYVTETEAFFSTTDWLSPYCVFAPVNSTTLTSGVQLLVHTNTSFAVRSGGHQPIPGFASTDYGVMIATTHFTEKTLVPTPNEFGETYIRAGAAFRWQEVYDFLNPYGLVAIGGRVAPVGSSLILGGGLSYHSYLHGWAANNVVNFELVTANGTILQVNNATHPNLFWALKGGSNNFGIVTRYDLRTYPTGPVYGGSVTWASNATQQYLDAFTAYISPGGGIEDPKANMMPSFSFEPLSGVVALGNIYFYNANVSNPEAFENFTTIPTMASEVGVMNFSTLTNQTAYFSELVNRWGWYDTAVLFGNESTQLIHHTVVNCTVGFAAEPIPVSMQQAAIDNGGDAMDLDPSRGGFLVAEVYVTWSDAADDEVVKEYLTSTIADIDRQSKEKGLYYPFTWLNDAGFDNSPISTYGYGESLRKMKAVSHTYDPAGVFQKLVPGFKLGFDWAG
ncbi:hypothetical protein UA08_05973 [Talaromyces atroroseus]|uniref:FAD linked oxidase N-terminal domain-containing protein n=1 Tax=Talaromyces atroroseus TaxID=1441469 RepID=A0A225AL65_TALAT|nr:hypothetical protein UA08_05973 [Talaromyces atroroseus]OKL59054.1 hypothetical protein UA08_05973 [Talaromyces atroroseus]